MTRKLLSKTDFSIIASPELSAQTAFACNRLNRHSERREIESEVAYHRADKRARAFILVGDTPLLKTNNEPQRAFFTLQEAMELGQEKESAYLGMLDDIPIFSLLYPTSLSNSFSARTDVELVNLRAIASEGLLPADELAPLGEAKALMDWHRRHGFCANCGTATLAFTGGFRRDCPSCKAQHFPRVDPVVIMLVTDGEHCLLGRQPQFAPGMYSALAGFIEPGETIEDAVRREIKEEAGIQVGAVCYLASQPWPFPSSLMIGCIAKAITTDLTIDHLELEDARWFSREEARTLFSESHPDGLTAPRPMAIAHHLLRAFVDAEQPLI